MNLAWIDRGTAGGRYRARPAALIKRVVTERDELERLRTGAAAQSEAITLES